MKKIWRQFVAWATASRSNLFGWTRVKLTFLYVLIIVITLAIYSTALYIALLHNIRAEIVSTTNQALRRQIFDAAVDRAQLQIFLIDAATFIIAAVGSYWLAGVNLRPIKRALQAQEEFSGDASHELRTPLAVMKTDIEVLLRSPAVISDEVRLVLESNLEEIQTLTTMTAELLELARGKEKHVEPVSLKAVLNDEVALLAILAKQKNITLHLEDQSTRMVYGDKNSIGRVFKNIIANAITYTHTGGVSIAITDTHNKTLVTITDTGIGIKKEQLPFVFKRFYKTDAGQGSGLGLAIAKYIVEQYKGTIDIESIVGQGTTVTVVLPSSPLHTSSLL